MKGFNITGEISKREVGLISLVIITTAGVIFTVKEDKQLAVAFFGITCICIMFFFIDYIIERGRKNSMSNRLSNLYNLEMGWEVFEFDGKLDIINTARIKEYESIYLKAIAENNLPLAEVFKNKIEELKKDDCLPPN